MRLQRSKGFSMIEIIVSLSIFILILAVCIKLVFFSRIKEKHADKSLAYYLLASKLNYYLKNDLRAVYRSKIGKIHGEDRYSLYVSYENDKGEAKFKPISY
ncbi:prepilin-type N-terminal cleavage/methylation domain-containing protein, partial [bacterium]|nr:prepilin-type N-terminal cleavage/methylation domain-containing protein [bacterium]